jgi:protein-disulfide isomerase
MTSGKKARKQRRTPAPPPVRSTGGGVGARRASPKVLAAAAAAVAIAAVAAALAFALTGGSSSSSTSTGGTLPDAATVVSLFKGIPQHGNVLGKPNAPVTMVEYIDLQCPGCQAFETQVMPTIIPRYVRSGKLRVIARPIAFIGPDSVRGRRAALAAAQQNHFFDFAQLLYDNQGTENTGWLDAKFVESAFASIPGLDAARASRASDSAAVTLQSTHFDDQATADKVIETPTILVAKTAGKLTKVENPSIAELSAAIDDALGQ